MAADPVSLWFEKKAAEQLLGVAVGIAQRYSAKALTKSAEAELTRAMIAALVSSAPLVATPSAETLKSRNRFQRAVDRGKAKVSDIRRNRKTKKFSKKLAKSEQARTTAVDIAKGGMPTGEPAVDVDQPTVKWRVAFRDRICAAAREGLSSTDDDLRKQWRHLIAGQETEISDQQLVEWADKVTVAFALQIRQRKKLEFLVAELEDEEARAHSIAAAKATEQIAAAIYGIAAAILVGAGAVAVVIALH